MISDMRTITVEDVIVHVIQVEYKYGIEEINMPIFHLFEKVLVDVVR